jgi:DNA polymerase I
MKTFVFDIEANSQYVRQVTKVHCLVVMDADTEEMWSYGPSEIEQGIAKLQEAERIVAHNGIQYDAAVLRRLYGAALPPCLDTLIVSRILYPDFKKHPFGGNSIEDWGRKLGNPKIKYEGGWDTFTQEMLRYCQQDVRVGLAVYRELRPQFKALAFPLKLEHQVTSAIQRQEETGVRFDMERASVLEQQLLTDLAQLEDDLQEAFPPKAVQLKTKVKYVPFNPGSRQQCAERLIEKYGWKPKVLTDGGKPKFDEKIVAKLDYPEAELMCQYLMQGKRLSMLTSLVNAVQEDGRIHGSVNPMGLRDFPHESQQS